MDFKKEDLKINVLENKEWVTNYISKWIEKNTPFKVKSIELVKGE